MNIDQQLVLSLLLNTLLKGNHVINASNYDVTEILKGGLEVRIRAMRPDDKKRIVEAFNNLEKESIYTRFFQSKSHLTPEELVRITELDFEDVVSLVVTIGTENDETIIGTARYTKFIDPSGANSAEISFTVEEDYHGQGIAGNLMRKLTTIAKGNGVQHFFAEVLASNRGMLKVFKRSGLPMEQQSEGEITHVTLSLTGSDD